MKLKPLLLAIAVLALGAAPAQAATARIIVHHEPSSHGSDIASAALEYQAAPGESNRLTVTGTASDIVLTDAGAPITPVGGCAALDEHSVRCTLTALSLSDVSVALDDGDDRITGDRPTGVVVKVGGGPGDDTLEGDGGLSGGDGNDRLVGGAGSSTLDGGPGNDELDGGPGSDTVTYAGRTAPVTIDLQAGRGGEAGETDSYTGIENAFGGDGTDDIRGDAGPNFLYGQNGLSDSEAGDRLSGGGGNDTLSGSKGADVLSGGSGGDRLSGGGGPDHFDGGDGSDVIQTSGGPAQRLTCGNGIDIVRPAPEVVVPKDCEVAQMGWYDVAVAPLYAKVPSLRVRVPVDDSANQPACSAKAALTKGKRQVARTRRFAVREGAGARASFSPRKRIVALRGTIAVGLSVSAVCPAEAPQSIGGFSIRR